jgi:hypothetical protein
MSERLTDLAGFVFIVAVPLVLVAGGLVTLFAVGALFEALDHPDQLRARIEAAFRRPEPPPRTPGAEHYYRRYWPAR